MYGIEFNWQMQVYAARGYVVLYTNPRGSTGYGEKFLWGTWGAWGNKDGEDVISGIDALASRFPIDRARVGSTTRCQHIAARSSWSPNCPARTTASPSCC